MRPARESRPVLRAVSAAMLLVVALAGCGGLANRTLRSYDIAPSGLDVWEDALRRSLVAGQFEQAWRRSETEKAGGPGDRLLRALYAGAAAHYAGRYAESARALERAAEIADDRYTRSASKGALALVTNDRALAYVPGQTERLMVHYYALLDYMKQDDAEGAAVEARRMSALLQRYADAGSDPLDASTRAVLRYLAGVAFEAAGQVDDADVAYRNARALVGPRTARDSVTPLWSTATRADSGTGDVVVLVEQGFVAHRVDQSLYLRLGGGSEAMLSDGSGVDGVVERILSSLTGTAGGGLYADAPLPVIAFDAPTRPDSARARVPVVPGDLRIPAAAPGRPTHTGGDTRAGKPAVGEVLRGTAEQAATGGRVPVTDAKPAPAKKPGRTSAVPRVRVPDDERDEADEDEGASAVTRAARAETERTFRLAWPAYRRPVATSARLAVVAGSGAVMPLAIRGDVSDAVVADFKRDRARLLARLVVRATARQAITKQASKKSSELGSIVSGLASTVLERADTRSWHLLPGSIGVVRLRLPAGVHTLRLAADGTVQTDGGTAGRLLGDVVVRPGGLSMVTTRVWSGHAGTAPGTLAEPRP